MLVPSEYIIIFNTSLIYINSVKLYIRVACNSLQIWNSSGSFEGVEPHLLLQKVATSGHLHATKQALYYNVDDVQVPDN
jgi:hypothetical protein